MLTIRREQMKAVGEAMRREFELRTLEHLRQGFPVQTETRADEQLLAMIARGIDRAAGYGIVSEIDVTRYIEYMAMYGPDFDSQIAGVGEILVTQGIPGGEKMNRIDDYDQFVMNRE